ncbi:potassium-transporting ATPase subunit KdpC [Salinibacterium sp. UTAS2018]|uniref:potassium-transporting ATPase subunit KdpC n=1 Tax=Salinibacterium sp. UTAS2018 TaxID=2508880 RepID=UPI001009567A|nr:potassium-transporting ATPase subunit KdpC [Salinibacterium sp. UTAS2018]QAV70925.1 potassium-transporting ATPase subunit KdpC [Salinibacterium sp. UTAS2018]
MSSSRTGLRQLWVAVRALIVLTVVLGIVYPLAMTGIGQLVMPRQANGSILTVDGTPVGSALIGQSFIDADGEPLSQYFQPRPSAAGDGYDAAASSGSNWGPENPDLIAAIKERRSQIFASDAVTGMDIPADALTASSSGLDPHISPAYALLQVAPVAAERNIPESEVEKLVQSKIQNRDLGYLGEPTVNVLQLNIMLDALGG